MSRRARRIASQRIAVALRKQNGGRLPRSVAGWVRLCGAFGLDAVSCSQSVSEFTACLTETAAGQWIAFYNRHARADRIRRFLCHELAEYLCQADYPTLFPAMRRGYSGGDNPGDDWHLIAREVEQACFRERSRDETKKNPGL